MDCPHSVFVHIGNAPTANVCLADPCARERLLPCCFSYEAQFSKYAQSLAGRGVLSGCGFIRNGSNSVFMSIGIEKLDCEHGRGAFRGNSGEMAFGRVNPLIGPSNLWSAMQGPTSKFNAKDGE